MRQQIYQIKEESDKIAVNTAILDLEIGKGKEVVLRDSKISLSTMQRNAFWWWVGIVSVDTGYTKDEVYYQFKEDHLVKIFRRDDPGFEAMYDPLNALFKVDRDKAKVLVKSIINLMSITEATASQMREAMDLFQMQHQSFS